MLVGSILVGALAGFALLNYVRGVEDTAREEIQTTEVLVVSAEIAAGTPASVVRETGRLELRETESKYKPATAITDLSQIDGRVAVADLPANQILVVGMFVTPETIETTFADLVPQGEVAVSIKIPIERAVAGLVSPGDFVDIIALGDPPLPLGEVDAFDTSPSLSPYQQPARYLYRGVRIIAVNDKIFGINDEEEDSAEEDTAGDNSYVMAVPAEAAQRILSVPEVNIVFGLLPEGWTPEARPNAVFEDILSDAELPGENARQVTPYGPTGWEDALKSALGDDSTPADDTPADETSTEGEG